MGCSGSASTRKRICCISTTTRRACAKTWSSTSCAKPAFRCCAGLHQPEGPREEFALPLYEYKCVKCGHLFEKIESFSASPKKKCPKCGAKAERQMGHPAIQFKGSGWYVTDYGGKKPSGDGSSS